MHSKCAMSANSVQQFGETDSRYCSNNLLKPNLKKEKEKK